MVGDDKLAHPRATTGRLSYVAGILPRAKWAVAIFYATIAAVERESLKGSTSNRASTRDDGDKAGLVHVKRLKLARTWFVALLGAEEIWRTRRIPLDILVPQFAITTDASPFGIGAILFHVDWDKNLLVPLVAVKLKVTRNIAKTLGIECHQPSGQAALEAWTTLVAFRYWAPKLKAKKCLLRADATVALAIRRWT